jgi:hypothetical protein
MQAAEEDAFLLHIDETIANVNALIARLNQRILTQEVKLKEMKENRRARKENQMKNIKHS